MGLARQEQGEGGRGCTCRDQVTLWAEWLELDLEVGKVLGT